MAHRGVVGGGVLEQSNLARDLLGEHRPTELPDDLHLWFEGRQKVHGRFGWNPFQQFLLGVPPGGVRDGVYLCLGQSAVVVFPLGVFLLHFFPDFVVDLLHPLLLQGGTADAGYQHTDLLQEVMEGDGIQTAHRHMQVPAFLGVALPEGPGHFLGVADLALIGPGHHLLHQLYIVQSVRFGHNLPNGFHACFSSPSPIRSNSVGASCSASADSQ